MFYLQNLHILFHPLAKLRSFYTTKLDMVDYSEKLGAILAANNIRSLTVVRMEVPCCGGMEYAVQRAVAASGKALDVKVAVISTDGRILKESI